MASTTTTAPAVAAHGIGKRYGAFVALEDFSLSVEPGEVLGVLGPNGAGKTTAIRVLTTILAPTSGSFEVAGVPHTRPGEIRQRIGVLPESAGYPERQTGSEYLRYHARLFGHSRASAESTARRLLEEVGLGERAGSLVSNYSRGMRQRLGIARALVNEPSVVFLDEPTLGLDPAGQRQILATVRGIANDRGAAVLLSTHLLAEVEEICSRVVILNRGRVISEGTVTEVARQAAAPRSARVHVEPDDTERATAALMGAAAVEAVDPSDGRPGWLVVRLASSGGPANAAFDAAVRALLDAQVSVISVELEGSRLSDAFMTMTEAA